MEIRKGNYVFMYDEDFLRTMQSKLYFTETKPGIFERNSKFRLKYYFAPNTGNEEVEAFGWRVSDRINEDIKSTSHEKKRIKLSNNKKTVLRIFIRAKITKSLLTTQIKTWQTRTKQIIGLTFRRKLGVLMWSSRMSF